MLGTQSSTRSLSGVSRTEEVTNEEHSLENSRSDSPVRNRCLSAGSVAPAIGRCGRNVAPGAYRFSWAKGKSSDSPQPVGLLIYTRDWHASVQLMYPQASLSNEFVHDGYEATFGTYELDAKKHLLTYHVQASATREKLVGREEILTTSSRIAST